MAQQEETRYIGAGSALTRLSDGATVWVLDTTGPFKHTGFIRYLRRMQRTYAVICEDGLHIYEGIDKPQREPAQPERPITSIMHQRRGRWFFNDADNDSDEDDDIYSSAPDDSLNGMTQWFEDMAIDNDNIDWGTLAVRTNVYTDTPALSGSIGVVTAAKGLQKANG